MVEVDEKDELILKALQEDSSRSIKELEELTDIPGTTIHNRIKKMEKNNILQGYTVKINRSALYGDIVAFILIQIHEVDQKSLVAEFMTFNEVEEASIVTGEIDILLRVRVRSIEELNHFLLDRLRKVKGIANSTSMISLEYHSK